MELLKPNIAQYVTEKSIIQYVMNFENMTLPDNTLQPKPLL